MNSSTMSLVSYGKYAYFNSYNDDLYLYLISDNIVLTYFLVLLLLVEKSD